MGLPSVMRAVKVTTCLALLAAVLVADSRADGLTRMKNVPYCTGGGTWLVLDLTKPAGQAGPFPGLVFVHGGAWHHGDKRNLWREAQAAARRGYVAVSINYRLAPTSRFPAAVEDVKCAVRWMRANAARLGVDPARIGAFGTSAGGNLVAMLAVTAPGDGLEGTGGWPPLSSAVQAVVDWFGPTDLTLLWSTGNSDSTSALTDFLGGPPTGNPTGYRRASPLSYVSAGRPVPPAFVVQGDIDPKVPPSQSANFVAALRSVGGAATLDIVPGAGHDLLVPWHPVDTARHLQEAFNRSMAFLDGVLKPGAAAQRPRRALTQASGSAPPASRRGGLRRHPLASRVDRSSASGGGEDA
jgi:acetyl esterase/lipase